MSDLRNTAELILPFIPPYDWPAIAAFFAKRAIPGVELVHSERYRRTITIGPNQGTLDVTPGAGNFLRAVLTGLPFAALPEAEKRVRAMFDLDADPAVTGAHLSQDPRLAPLVARRPGLRVPGGWDGFEIAVRAIAGQQVTLSAATSLATKLVTLCSVASHSEDPELSWLFPQPEQVAATDLSSLPMPAARIGSLRRMAVAAASKPDLFNSDGPPAVAITRLTAIPGVGDWTAQYISMRYLRWADALPAADVVLRRLLQEGENRLTRTDVLRRAEIWRPWRSYAVLHLWTSDALDGSPEEDARAALA